jgi:hypothetical protein
MKPTKFKLNLDRLLQQRNIGTLIPRKPARKRLCSNCKQRKPIKEFYSYNHNITDNNHQYQYKHITSLCKKCTALTTNKWKKAHPKSVKKYRKNWYASHGKIYYTKYHKTHKKEMKENSRRYKLKDPTSFRNMLIKTGQLKLK